MRPATADYDARWGYRQLDARRYERRRYGGAIRRLNHRLLERGSFVYDALYAWCARQVTAPDGASS